MELMKKISETLKNIFVSDTSNEWESELKGCADLYELEHRQKNLLRYENNKSMYRSY